MKFRLIRNQKVITDADLAEALSIPNKQLIGFFKRNINAFAQDAYFTLTKEEQQDLIQNYCATHNERLRYAKRLPFVFTAKAVIPMLCMQSKNAAAKVLKNKFFDATPVASADIEEILK